MPFIGILNVMSMGVMLTVFFATPRITVFLLHSAWVHSSQGAM
jgi:hypothetical protein